MKETLIDRKKFPKSMRYGCQNSHCDFVLEGRGEVYDDRKEGHSK
jgi:hypothetical protein